MNEENYRLITRHQQEQYENMIMKSQEKTDKDSLTLKPCPFCGGSVEIKVNGRWEAVYVCTECHAEVTWKKDLVPWRENHDEWNRRAKE